MLKIGITQRVDEIASYGERRDALDQQWVAVFEKEGMLPVPLFNKWSDPEAAISALQLDGILLSGGNDISTLSNASNTAPERDSLETTIIRLALEQSLPVFGVCRGMQMIGHYFGSELVPIDRKAHIATRHPFLGGEEVPSRDEVNSFHGWGFSELKKPLVALGRAPDAIPCIEALRHESAPLMGIMWHPERAPFDPRDRALIRTFFEDHSS